MFSPHLVRSYVITRHVRNIAFKLEFPNMLASLTRFSMYLYLKKKYVGDMKSIDSLEELKDNEYLL